MSLRPEDAAGYPSKWSTQDPWSAPRRAPGAYPSSPSSDIVQPFSSHQSISAAMTARKAEYVRKEKIKVKVGTWNTAASKGTYKDLGGWFTHGLGVKGLTQNLSGASLSDESDDDDTIESVEDQERRRSKYSSTLPSNDVSAVASDEEIGLYVLGLQEVVDVASVTEAIRPYTDPNPGKKWKRAMKRSLPYNYVRIVEQQLLGLLLLVYAAPSVASQITLVDATSVGTGALGYLGNKGAVSARMVLGESLRLIFVNCHLAAGADSAALARRLWDTKQILNRTKFVPIESDLQDTNRFESIGDEDLAFWFGDLNYRLDDIPGEDVRRLLLLHTRNEYDVLNKSKRRIDSELGYVDPPAEDVASKVRYEETEPERPASESTAEPPLDPKTDPASLHTTLQSLLIHDQLRSQQRQGKAFHEGWREGDIDFLPTYKYDVGSVGMFDSGEKKRSPSWCDRILFRTRKDRLSYEEKRKEADLARKRDEQMRQQGLDTAAAQEDVLFDYNPDTDGDVYDEYDDAEENFHDAELVHTNDSSEDAIEIEAYVSHQRVLSSDHKPLTAVFSITYDAVVPELKARLHQEVARDFDKAENEGRPNVTVVVEHLPETTNTADKTTEGLELNLVDFGNIRYDLEEVRNMTIANTGQIAAMFAFIDRPVEIGQNEGPAPSWLSIGVDKPAKMAKINDDDFEESKCYELLPGESVNVELSIHVIEGDLVYVLNSCKVLLDEILVLRILNGRDHFISIKATWLQTAFFRSLDELVRAPSGIRNLKVHASKVELHQPPPSSPVFHSAPNELFALTDLIPQLLERTVAEWDMLHDEDEKPWETVVVQLWPFEALSTDNFLKVRHPDLSAEVREALDVGLPPNQEFPAETPPRLRLEAITDVLVTFLASLRDGIVTTALWQEIEPKLIQLEKSRSSCSSDHIQDIVMEVLSSEPIHSVSFTFITFMITRTISELAVAPDETAMSPRLSTRSRSSTNTSEAPSETSITSGDSSKGLRSFFPTLQRRTTNTVPKSPKIPLASKSLEDRRNVLTVNYASYFAPLLIRSEGDGKLNGKEKRVLEQRKKKALEAFLDTSK